MEFMLVYVSVVELFNNYLIISYLIRKKMEYFIYVTLKYF